MTVQKIQRLRQKLVASRARLMREQPFFALLLMYMKFIAVPNMKQISTNGICIFFSPVFLESLGQHELDFILCHQIMHIVRGDIWRHLRFAGDRFHYSSDLLVNMELEQLGLQERSCAHFRCIRQTMTLEKFVFDTEELFSDMGKVEDQFEAKLKNKRMFDTDEYWDDKTNWGHSGIQILDAAQEGIWASRQKNRKSPTDMSNESGGSLSDDSLSDARAGSKCPSDQNKTAGELSRGEYDLHETTLMIGAEELREIWKEQLLTAAEMIKITESSDSTPGFIPVLARRRLGIPKQAVVDWKKALREFIQEETCDYSFCPPDRRYGDGDFFMPDFNEDMQTVKDVLFWVDTSGSVSDDDLAMAYAEIADALTQFQCCLNGKIGFFDGGVTEPVPFYSVTELMKIPPVGGGGTDFQPIFTYIQKEYRRSLPSCVIIFTDGYGYFPRKEDTMEIPVLWLINNLDVTPPFGRTLRFGREVIANSRKRRKH